MKCGFAVALLLIACGAARADDRASIEFQRGKSGAVVAGPAFSDSMTCFTLETEAGQTATVRIVESGGEDTAFNIADLTRDDYVADNQVDYSFPTDAGTYQIDVYRTFARRAPVAFRMAVSVK